MTYCPRLHNLLLPAALLFVVAPTQRVVAGMVVLAPVVDGHVTTNIIEDHVTVSVTTNSPVLPLGRPVSSVHQKPVLEFDLSSLATGTIVVSATLELFTATPDQNPQFAGQQILRGYVGDGIITPADTGGSNLRFFSQSQVVGQPNDLDVTSFIQGLPEGSIAGFSLDGSFPTAGPPYEYYSSEAANPDLHPRLILEVVPEPASLTLASVGLVAMLLARRDSTRRRTGRKSTAT